MKEKYQKNNLIKLLSSFILLFIFCFSFLFKPFNVFASDSRLDEALDEPIYYGDVNFYSYGNYILHYSVSDPNFLNFSEWNADLFVFDFPVDLNLFSSHRELQEASTLRIELSYSNRVQNDYFNEFYDDIRNASDDYQVLVPDYLFYGVIRLFNVNDNAYWCSSPFEFYVNQVELPSAPIADGYQFVDWYLDKNLTLRYDGRPVTDDMTLYAGWRIISVLDDTPDYKFAGWFLNEELTITANNKVISLDTPVFAGWKINYEPEREHYDFDGWFFDEDLTIPYENEVVPFGTILYQKWKIKKYVINFVVPGLTINSIQLDALTSFTPDAVEKAGYTFDGWFVDAGYIVPYTDGSELTRPLTLYGKFTIITYKVSFIVNNEVYAELDVPYGTVFKTAQQAMQSLYQQSFLMFLDPSKTLEVDYDEQILSDITVYSDISYLPIDDDNENNDKKFIFVDWIKSNYVYVLLGVVVFILLVVIIFVFIKAVKR